MEIYKMKQIHAICHSDDGKIEIDFWGDNDETKNLAVAECLKGASEIIKKSAKAEIEKFNSKDFKSFQNRTNIIMNKVKEKLKTASSTEIEQMLHDWEGIIDGR